MKKILVPTDFSGNSKSAIRLAINWAKQQKLELVFVHVLHILRATRWTDSYFNTYAKKEEADCRIKLEKFIAAIYRSMGTKAGKHSFIIIRGISADISMLDYCKKNPGIDYICISTRGAGGIKKIFGTNTGNLITKSQVPVLAVPEGYRVSDIKNVMYATDLRDYDEEIKKVIAFAYPLKAKIEAVHFTWTTQAAIKEEFNTGTQKPKYKYGLQINYGKADAALSLVKNIQKQIRLMKPSVVIMFTDQRRSFFQKIFLSSKSEELSFEAKVPLLIFNKSEKK